MPLLRSFNATPGPEVTASMTGLRSNARLDREPQSRTAFKASILINDRGARGKSKWKFRNDPWTFTGDFSSLWRIDMARDTQTWTIFLATLMTDETVDLSNEWSAKFYEKKSTKLCAWSRRKIEIYSRFWFVAVNIGRSVNIEISERNPSSGDSLHKIERRTHGSLRMKAYLHVPPSLFTLIVCIYSETRN